MSKQKPSIPSGTRDFGPVEVAKRNYIINIIRSVYELYGYQPLETPVMENLSTLMGKYGAEGDKLLFKILNSGDWAIELKKKINAASISQYNDLILVSEKGLRYDLTVPFARYVVMNQNEITFPFKRYQIQPVWRADRPQKGRYREFYQCDADVIGSNSLLNEIELIQIISDVFSKLNIHITIKLNNRKILNGIAEITGMPDRIIDITIAVDKYDKIGSDGVKEELKQKGFNDDSIKKIFEIILMHNERILFGGLAAKDSSNINNLNFLKSIDGYANSNIFQKGVEEMDYIFERENDLISNNVKIKFDITLARGLNYYTGTIFEVVSNDVKIGSILGGGRYDDLTGIFGLPNMSGVGISFGLDRIYDVLTELNLFPENAITVTTVLIIPFDTECENKAIEYATQLRRENISTEIYPDLQVKIGKKFKYADDKNIPFAIVIGSDELKNNLVSIKNMKSGEQKQLTIEELITELNNDIKSYSDFSE
ncbi:MAG: histidine--tRNA ligase [Fimbriimonadaceae bacterium]|nr:histidine--tRNA ligase [Chitinophagales bacterium]